MITLSTEVEQSSDDLRMTLTISRDEFVRMPQRARISLDAMNDERLPISNRMLMLAAFIRVLEDEADAQHYERDPNQIIEGEYLPARIES